MPRYVTIDLFGAVGVGKTTIFELFAEKKHLREGGNLSIDFRRYYARCWVLKQRWSHSMIWLADPKLEFFWRDLKVKTLRRLFEPTNILIIVSNSTQKDVNNIKEAFSVFPKIKRKLIIYIIANMQDCEGRMSAEEIKNFLNVKDVLGISAVEEGAREKLESYFEKACFTYFKMLSKRGEYLPLLEEDEIGLGRLRRRNENKKSKPTKYSERLAKLKKNNPSN